MGQRVRSIWLRDCIGARFSLSLAGAVVGIVDVIIIMIIVVNVVVTTAYLILV